MNCEFVKTESGLRCIRCERIVHLDVPAGSLKAMCRISVPTEGMERYVRQISSPRPSWEFIYLDPEKESTHTANLLLDPPDNSRIGTWLTGFFHSLGYDQNHPSCFCKSLSTMLDQASWNLINSNKEMVVDLIQESARQIGVNPSKLAIYAAVRLALFKNRTKRGTSGRRTSLPL